MAGPPVVRLMVGHVEDPGGPPSVPTSNRWDANQQDDSPMDHAEPIYVNTDDETQDQFFFANPPFNRKRARSLHCQRDTCVDAVGIMMTLTLSCWMPTATSMMTTTSMKGAQLYLHHHYHPCKTRSHTRMLSRQLWPVVRRQACHRGPMTMPIATPSRTRSRTRTPRMALVVIAQHLGQLIKGHHCDLSIRSCFLSFPCS